MSDRALRLISLTPVSCDSSEPVREAGISLTIGRHHDNALHVCNDAAVVSSKHCIVEFVHDSEVLHGHLVDTRSACGSTLNSGSRSVVSPIVAARSRQWSANQAQDNRL